MAELSSHSYHYKDSIFNPESESILDVDDPGSKKKPRRRKRMLTGVSKQRRAANERERKRLQIINMAYKELKAALPLFPNEDNIPKIEIVRLATRTIKYLSDIVNKPEMNDIDHMRGRGSSEYSDMSESSPEGSIKNLDITSDIKLETIDTDDIDVSNLLFQPGDIKLEFEPTSQSSDISDGGSMTSSDGFSGLDISSFIGGNSSPRVSHDDVFPSMLYW